MRSSGGLCGGIILQLILVKLIFLSILLFIIFFFAVMLFRPKSTGQTTAAAAAGGSDTAVMNSENIDMGTGFLVCFNLPGVNLPKTPALDRRVARLLEAVRADLSVEGVPALHFTYGFRSTREQELVDPGSNYKARPGTSPHEAGRAVDVSGMRTRSDRGQVIATFKRHG